MNLEQRITLLENNLIQMSTSQTASTDSLKFYRYELYVPHTGDVTETQKILLCFVTTSEDMPLVMLHESPNSWGARYTIHPSAGSTKNTKKYYVEQSEDTTYILLSTQPGSFYRA